MALHYHVLGCRLIGATSACSLRTIAVGHFSTLAGRRAPSLASYLPRLSLTYLELVAINTIILSYSRQAMAAEAAAFWLHA